MKYLKFALILILVLGIGQAWAIDNHVIFETTNESDGNLGGKSGADGICMTEAESLGLNGEFISYLDYTTEKALDYLNLDMIYETPAGEINFREDSIDAPFRAFNGEYWYGEGCNDFSTNAVDVDGRYYINDGTSLVSNTDDCSNTHKLLCATLKACGNGLIEDGEVCDDDDIITETACDYGTQECTLCNADCTAELSLIGSYCGDKTVDNGEVCDDGNNVDETACEYGNISCTSCNSDCSANLTLNGLYCGDKILNLTLGEECDDGNNLTKDGCNAMCQNETTFMLRVHLFDYAKNLVTSIKNIGYTMVEITVDNLDSAETTVNAYIYTGKAVPAGIVGHNIYCDMQGVLCCISSTGYCKDYYVPETGGAFTGSPCVCNSTAGFNEKMPWMSVYPESSETISLEKSGAKYTSLLDEKEYRYSDCKRKGEHSVCYIKAYFEDPEGNIFDELYTLEIERDSSSKPIINYTIAGDPEANKDVYYIDVETFETASEDPYPVVFDASLSQFKSPTCYGGEECYFLDSNFLEYKWYIEIHNKPWGKVENFLCTNGTDSCVNPVCETQCADKLPCTCLQFDTDGEVYDGYVDNRKTFSYDFANSNVCGPEKSCAVTLTVTDKTTLASSTKQFGIILSGTATGDSPYGNYSQLCSVGGEQIGYTGYCCRTGYMVNPKFNNFNELFKNRMDACVEVPNKAPIARISFPEDDEIYKAGNNKDIYFRAEGSDSDGNITAYLWDFDDRTEPWGYLETNEYDEIVCEAVKGSKSCGEEEAVSLDDYDDEEQIPCSCNLKYSEDILNIYPESVSTKQKTVHTYENKYACSEYDEEKESECEVTLWVFDNEDAVGKTKITIELTDESSGDGIDGDLDIDFYCGDGLVTGTEECDIGEVSACDGGDCASDCTCVDEGDSSGDIELIDYKDSNQERDDTVCGNSICEFGENAVTCLTDCHCGDGKCQESMENKDSCSSDCKSGSNTTIILLVIILAAAGIIFLLYKQGFDFSKITDLFGGIKSKFGKGAKEINRDTTMPEMPSARTPESSLEEYIRSTRRGGFSYSQIKDALEKKGWKEDKINDIFRRVGLP